MQDLSVAFEQYYGDCQRTLTEISYDDANERTFCVSEDKYLDFDRLAQKYFAGKNVKVEKQQLQFKLLTSILLYERIAATLVNLNALELVSTKFVYLVVFDPENCPPSSARTKGIVKHLDKVKVRFGVDKYKGSFLADAFTPEGGDEFKRILQRFGVTVQA